MWNKDRVMLMLEDFSKKDKQTIQSVIDRDKYINSEILNCDLCGSYAPFCECCPLHSRQICARAYADYRMIYKGGALPVLGAYSLKDESGIQKVIDEDKYYLSRHNNRDLCGDYADFCAVCVKKSVTPCADAYLKYTRSGEKIKLGTVRYKRKTVKED